MPELSQNLFYRACSTVSAMREKGETIDPTSEMFISFEQYKDKLGDQLPFRDYMGSLINTLNRQQVTNSKNHLALNFYTKCRR